MSGYIPSVPGANTEMYLLHFWCPMWGLEILMCNCVAIFLYCKGHKGKWTLVDRPAFHLHPNPSNLCLVLPHQTTPMCWGSLLCVCSTMKLSPAGLKFEVVKNALLNFGWTLKWVMNIWYFEHSVSSQCYILLICMVPCINCYLYMLL